MSPDNPMSSSELGNLINKSSHVVVLQADNPDGDSLGSALALEEILSDLGKDVTLYCGIDLPGYLHYFSGWDRVVKELPPTFDLAIIVDASSMSLFETLTSKQQQHFLGNKDVIVLDHHTTSDEFPFDVNWYQKPAVATSELIYDIAVHNNWTISIQAAEHIVSAIMSDSLGLTSEATTAESIQIIANLVKAGVNLAKLDANRREIMKKSPELLSYKGQLLERIEYWADGRIALITIPWSEIEKYSHDYNPSMLVIDEMRMVTDVQLAIALKQYSTGRVTGKIRANFGSGVAAELAQSFGGGGHRYASGFKVQDTTDFKQLKLDIINKATELLDNMTK